MFRDDRQTARACIALVDRLPRTRGLWTEDGPTDEAVSLMERSGGTLSSGERVLLLTAFAFWNGSGGLSLADVIQTLDAEHMAAVAGLMVAVAEGARGTFVDRWLKEQEALRDD